MQSQLKKKIKNKSLKMARRMRMSESEYSGYLQDDICEDGEEDVNPSEVVGDPQVEEDGEDDDIVKSDEGATSLTIEEEAAEDDDDEEEEDEDEGQGASTSDDEEDDEEEEEVGEEEEEEEDEEGEEEGEEVAKLPSHLCVLALQRLIAEEDL